jgi:hypothetical protein
MRGFTAAAAAAAVAGLVAFSSAAWAIVGDDMQSVPVSDQHGPIPSGTIELKKTTGETIAKVPVKDGAAQIPKDAKIERKTKIIIIVHDDKTNETFQREKRWGSFLDSGINTVAVSVIAGLKIAQNEMPRPADRVYFTSNYFATVGVGVAATHNESTGAFFGPGTGGGVSLTNSDWQGSVDFTGGLFTNFAPGWYGGAVVNVYTPPFGTSTQLGSTSTGIPVTSKINQTGVAVDILGRVGSSTAFPLFPFIHDVFFEGGAETARFEQQIMASTVGDNFQGSKQLWAPVVGVGAGFCPFGSLPGEGCAGPKVFVEYDHMFYNSSSMIGVTPASDGRSTVGGQDRITVGVSDGVDDLLRGYSKWASSGFK